MSSRETYDLQVKTKRWITLIQTGNLGGIAQDVQVTLSHRPLENLDKSLFKCLLYLSHAADKCDKRNYLEGKYIFELADLFCSNLAGAPDYDKFLLSIYHITRCLVAMRLYNEAGSICQHLALGKGLTDGVSPNEIFLKTVSLWRNPISEAFKALEAEPYCPSTYENLKIIVSNELRVIKAVQDYLAKLLFVKVRSYLDKMALISRVKANNIFDDFCKHIFETVAFEHLTTLSATEYGVYGDCLGIISRLVCEHIMERKGNAEKVLSMTYSNFTVVILRNDEFYKCSQLFRNVCALILKPVEEMSSDDAEQIEKCAVDCALIGETYGYDGALKSTAISIVQIFEPLCMHWENELKAGRKELLLHGVLSAIMKFIQTIDVVFLKQTSYKCKCQESSCAVSRDLYNATVTKIQCTHLITKISRNDLSREICEQTCNFLKQCVSAIKEMKESKCKCWIRLWSTCGTLIYNMGILSKNFYKEIALLFSLLCSSIIYFEGIQAKSSYLRNLQNPICSTLHRLSTVHYAEGMYREAMTASALNGLLSYRDESSKAFRMWTDIQHKCSVTKTDENLSMLACLRQDRSKIAKMIGLEIELAEYDLIELCLREAKALQEAKVNLSAAILRVRDELCSLKASPMQYSYVAQLLGTHLLSFDHEECLTDYLGDTLCKLKLERNKSAVATCSEANVKFFVFVNELNIRNRRIQAEMQNASLYPTKRSTDAQSNESCDVIPAYFSTNIKEETVIMAHLEESLSKWEKCFAHLLVGIVLFTLTVDAHSISALCSLYKQEERTEHWILSVTLRILLIAAEYSRLFRNHDSEVRAWILAYKLANKLQDHRAMIYVTGRAVSLRQINHEWIADASQYAHNLKGSSDEEILCAIAIFWISLSDYYFELGQCDEARNLIDDARNLPSVSFLSNVSTYLLSLDTIVRNYHLYEDNGDHDTYSSYMVECLYTMINLHESLSVKKWWKKDEFLFAYDTLFTSSINMSFRMNSMLCFREISAHLVNRLKAAQALGATIRVAELLKSLCLIDLSRSKLDDCEVKLQGLEHIMDTERFCQSPEARHKIPLLSFTPKTVVRPSKKASYWAIDPVRDIPENGTSPVLKSKPFTPPDFLQRFDCSCYTCRNPSCRCLFLASTYVRGQMHALRDQTEAALTHFHGAFKIAANLFQGDRIDASRRTTLSWHERFYLVDYVLLLIDFSSFLSKEYSLPRYEEEALQLAALAAQLCLAHGLKGHPVYLSTQELFIDIRFQLLSSNFKYDTEISVPVPSDIDVTKYADESKIDKKACVTPTSCNADSKKPPLIRRNRTPPAVKLSRVTMNLSEDDVNENSPLIARTTATTATTTTTTTTTTNNRKRNVKPVRRKILESDYRGEKEKTAENQSVKDIVTKLASSVPILSDHLHKLADDLNEPVTNQNMERLVDMVDSLKIDSQYRGKVSKVTDVRRSKRLSANENNRKINEAIEMFKRMIASEKLNYSSDRASDRNAVTSEGAIDKK